MYRGETVQFVGKWVDNYENRYGTVFNLYECPSGYRVHVDDFSGSGSYLHPAEVDRNSDDLEFDYSRTFTAEKVA